MPSGHRRRDAVRTAGGQFIDLYDAMRDEVGVAWFNDLIHPSRIGHRRIAAQICRAISGK